MATTTHLGVVLLEQSQAQKDVTVNEALARIDAILNTGAISRTLAAPPGSPAEGDVYLVASSGATDDWEGQENAIAYFDGGIWRFMVPQEGMSLWLRSEDKFYIWFNDEWNAETNHWRGYDQSQVHNLKALTDAASINWDLRYYPVAEVTLAGNRTLNNPSSGLAGGVYHLIVRQDATGSRSLTFGSAYHFPAGVAPTLSAAAGAVDRFVFVYDGTAMLGQALLDVR